MKSRKENNNFNSLHDFMRYVGGLRVDELKDRKIDLKVYEDELGYIMIYNESKAHEFARTNNLNLGTVVTTESGDDSSEYVRKLNYRTLSLGYDIKKYFFYTKKAEAFFEEEV